MSLVQIYQTFFRSLRNPKRVPTFVVTLDALGTIYRFKHPVATQYVDLAHTCGLKASIDTDQLNDSFKEAFKHCYAVYPNYGKRQLESPKEWWTKVIHRAFGRFVDQDRLPENLASRMYDHFAGSNAYELYPDALPLFNTLRALKKDFSDPDGPLILAGVVTNSDPRASAVLQAVGLKVQAKPPKRYIGEALSNAWNDARLERIDGLFASDALTFSQYNDIDFLSTSYETDYEKPDPNAWTEGLKLVQTLPLVRKAVSFRGSPSANVLEYMHKTAQTVGYRAGEVMWLHIGDEYQKDYLGATAASLDALLLTRDNDGEMPHKSNVSAPDVPTISSLDTAAMIINLKARGFFQRVS
ncbi:hypothetical protein PV08_05195 [Exophiala spinifera]|uniref:Haloacid dehalogenase, type II n=1 Tax=Exophiala spinifera TaxID=91928 RepID=A0A0D2B914_9EURO|nr:uncharacterized protein PV08_05195 [Exophiala spinifera]KIW15150.1 hypothetical protein PV08_05195 [Exophiala spinifera]